MNTATYNVVGKRGIHARASLLVSYLAHICASSWDVICIRGEEEADAKNIMELMLLGAGCGSQIEFVSLMPPARWELFTASLDELFAVERATGTADYDPASNILKETLGPLRDEMARGRISLPIEKFSGLPKIIAAERNKVRRERSPTGDRVYKIVERATSAVKSELHAIEAIEEVRSRPPIKAQEFDVFISHDSRDSAAAAQLHALFVQNGVKSFYAPISLPNKGDAEFFRAIEGAIEGSQHMVVVASEGQYLEGGWVRAEWTTFLNERRSGRKTGNLITLRLVDFPIADLPLALRGFQSELCNTDGAIGGSLATRILRFVGHIGN